MPFEYRAVRYPATAATDPFLRVLGIYTDERGGIIGATEPAVPGGGDYRALTLHLLAIGRAVTLPPLEFAEVYSAVYAPAAWLAVGRAARA